MVENLTCILPSTHTTEQTDREAHAYPAIVHLAPSEKYFAALGPDCHGSIIQTKWEV